MHQAHFSDRGSLLRRALVAIALTLAAAACSSPVTIAGDDTTTATEPPATTAAPEATVAPTTTTAPATTTSTTAVPATTQAPATTAAPLPDVASVATLIEPGAEPRTELRFDYADGQPFGIDVELTQSIEQEIDGVTPPASPPTKTTTGTTGTVVVSGGNFILEGTTDSAVALVEGDPSLTAAIQSALDPLVGLVERRTIDPTGVVLDFELIGADDIDPSILGPAAQGGQNGVALAFPIEAIGVGGIWETTATLDINGLEVVQTNRYEVVQSDGSNVVLNVVTTQFVTPGSEMDIPGATAIVDSWMAEGNGTLTLDLTNPVASGQVILNATQQLTVEGGGETAVIVQTITSETVTTPR